MRGLFSGVPPYTTTDHELSIGTPCGGLQIDSQSPLGSSSVEQMNEWSAVT